jgi:hypothetical protein
MVAFAIGQGTLEQDTLEQDDPVTAFLGLQELKAVTPPWIRVFRLSQQAPWSVQWEHDPARCQACGAAVVFATSERLPSVTRLHDMCLNCGHVEVEYKRPLTGRILGCLSGSDWSPPCPAVQKLRRAIFNQQKWFPWQMSFELDG